MPKCDQNCLLFQIKTVEDDGYYEVNFYANSKNGWNVLEIDHTLLESDIVQTIKPPKEVFKSARRSILIFEELT